MHVRVRAFPHARRAAGTQILRRAKGSAESVPDARTVKQNVRRLLFIMMRAASSYVACGHSHMENMIFELLIFPMACHATADK